MQDKNVFNNDLLTVPYIVYESEQSRSERYIKRLTIALIIAIALTFLSNALWLYEWCQYDYVDTTVMVDGGGDGNANYIGEDGDINNGENYSDEEKQDTNTGKRKES